MRAAGTAARRHRAAARLAAAAWAVLLAATIPSGCGGPALRPPSPAPPAAAVLPPGNGAFDEGGSRYFGGSAVVSPPAPGGAAAGDGGEAQRRADAEAVALANAAVDLFFNPAVDPATVDLALFLASARRNLAFGTSAAVIPRGRVVVVSRGPARGDGSSSATARVTEEELLAAIAEADMPEAARRSFRELLADRMGDHVEAWKRVRGR